MRLQNVGRYEIISELGRGAMGLVYKAKDPTIGRVVALKTMRLDVHGPDAEDMLRRFKNEAQAVGLLNHANIVTIYDAAEQDEVFYIAMEFIEGTTLHQVMSQKRVLPAEEVIRLARQICSGLDYAHFHGIVHRDVKPANVMITPDGTVKIMDFGIAKTGGSVTSTGQVLGTPNYMSPEQVKGKPLDGRSDLFSLGVVMYEMLTGEKPFVGQNVTTIIYKIVNESPTPPRDLDVTIHPGLSFIVTKALSKNPDERYQSGAEIVRDLENYKSLAPRLGLTKSISAASAAQSEKTAVLPVPVVSGSAVRMPGPVAVPDKLPGPLRQPVAVIKAEKKSVAIAAIAAVLFVAVVIGGYAWYSVSHRIRTPSPQPTPPDVAQTSKGASPMEQITPPKSDSAVKPDARSKTKKNKAASPNRFYAHQGELRFASQPDGAKVEVDGWTEPAWVTPFQASNLKEGQHTIVFSKPGFAPDTRTVTVVAGKSNVVSTQLSPVTSGMTINSTPQSASIWVDGKDTGKTTPAQITVEKGEHKVVVRKTGYKDAETAINFVDGQTYNFSPILTFQQGWSWRRLLGSESIPEGKGALAIHTKPDGATIILNGQISPKKSDVHWVLDPGSYTIVLEKDGYKPVHRTTVVEKGKSAPVDEILEKQKP